MQNLLEIWQTRQWLKWLTVIGLLYFLLVAVRLISTGFQRALGEQAETLFTFATNPFLGLVIGIFASAIIQSSSTVISILVGLVAGGFPVAIAIPIVMGANIGTTLTNTIVSLGHLNASEEFKRAFAAATVHDCFNVVCLLLLFPLEITFHGLETSASYFANFLLNSEISSNFLSFDILNLILNPVIKGLNLLSQDFPPIITSLVFSSLGLLLIFGTIFNLSRIFKTLLVGKARELLHNAMGKGALASFLAGSSITCLIQSSSATTSLMIPLAGNGVFTLEQIYPFTLGANLGTCFTALLAATALTGEAAFPGLEIALVNLLYNLVGIGLIYGLPILQPIPLQGARFFAEIATDYKLAALGYIIAIFLVLPALYFGITTRF